MRGGGGGGLQEGLYKQGEDIGEPKNVRLVCLNQDAQDTLRSVPFFSFLAQWFYVHQDSEAFRILVNAAVAFTIYAVSKIRGIGWGRWRG